MGITGYGKSEKKQVQLMVQRILKLKELPKPDDAADALAIAVTHINSLKSGLNIPKQSQNKNLKISGNKISVEEYKKLLKG